MIQVTKVVVEPEAEKLVLEVLRSGKLAQGPLVAELESQFAAAHGTAHAVAVNNGTTALLAALDAAGVGPGDEVITSPFTFAATLNAVLTTGASVRFGDIGDDFNLDPSTVAQQITSSTKALLPVHLYGQLADMRSFEALAAEHGLEIIEDAAQAVGASRDGKRAGSWGIGCFSMYATKNVSTGEGGMITTNSDEVANYLRILRNQGMSDRYVYEMIGQNLRLTDLAAALGIPQMNRLDEINERRRWNADQLRVGLDGIEGLLLPPEPPAGSEHVYHQFTIRITDESGVTRDNFVENMRNLGVACGVYYPKVVFDYECYADHPRVFTAPVPLARQAAAQVVSLPVHPHLTSEDLEQICSAARAAVA